MFLVSLKEDKILKKLAGKGTRVTFEEILIEKMSLTVMFG